MHREVEVGVGDGGSGVEVIDTPSDTPAHSD